MILNALYDYAYSAKDIPARGTELKEIEYVVVIDRNGRFLRFESKRINKRQCMQFLVAKGVASRTNVPKTNSLWDNGRYVFGFGEKDARHHDLFVARVREIAAQYPEDVSINALVKFYDTPLETLERDMSTDPHYDDVMQSLAKNFSFRLEDDDKLIAEKFADIGDDCEAEKIGRCLVTGLQGPIVRIFTKIQLLGSTQGAPLVAFQVNSGYDSYGKSQGFNAPISSEAEWAISAALKKLLAKDSRNKAQIGNRTFLFWGSGDSGVDSDVADSMAFLLNMPDKTESDPDEKVEKVSKLFKSIFSGEIRTTLNDRFHILGLAPNTGRIAVVMWVDSELRQFAEKIFDHFCDMEIVDTRKPESRRPYCGVYSMISAVTREGKLSDALPSLPEAVAEAVLNGSSYPMQLYTGALERIRWELSDCKKNANFAELEEGSVVPLTCSQSRKKNANFAELERFVITRTAILKAYINRKNKNSNKHKPLQVMLDKTNNNPGYLCGRLAAVLVKIQKDACCRDSIRTRYIGSASSTPATVFPAMLNVSVHHSEKLSEGRRIYFEQLKQEIVDKMPVEGFPNHLDLNDQGRFFVGYYHQLADLFTKKDNQE